MRETAALRATSLMVANWTLSRLCPVLCTVVYAVFRDVNQVIIIVIDLIKAHWGPMSLPP